MQGARWSEDDGGVSPSRPKQMFCGMPLVLCQARPRDSTGGGRDYQPGYIDRGPPRRPNNYDYNDDRAREERGETMAALVEASSRGVAAAVAAVSAASETIQKGYATNEPPTYYSGGGSGLLGSNGMGGLEPKGAGDNGDDGHGADAWMTTIEFDAQGNERFVDNSQPPPRRNQPPSPRPASNSRSWCGGVACGQVPQQECGVGQDYFHGAMAPGPNACRRCNDLGPAPLCHRGWNWEIGGKWALPRWSEPDSYDQLSCTNW